MAEVYKILADNYDNTVNLHLEGQKDSIISRTQFEIGPLKMPLNDHRKLGALNTRGREFFLQFSIESPFISETVRERPIVTTEVIRI